MSRVQRKRAEKKSKTYLKTCIFFMIIFLICGLIAVDFQIREMLAIDESGLIGYKQLENGEYIVHILGDSHLVDTRILLGQIYNTFAELREMAYNVKEWIENKW